MPSHAYTQMDLREGDPVLLFDINSPVQRRREYDPGKPGTVIKVGRKLVTIEDQYGKERVFRLEDGHGNDNEF